MKKLINRIEISVRFSENDPMGIVWHGNYIRYFEDGREAFGKQYGIGYMDYYNNKVMAPIVKLSCEYKRSLRFGDTGIIETEYEYTESAKIIFKYRILNKDTGELSVSGSSMQVFTDLNGNLMFSHPEFYTQWKIKMGFLAE
jgi:acyl-CoA thioester hydrolase